MAKFIVVISREVEFTVAFDIEAPSAEQAKILAQKQVASMTMDTTKWTATVHANNVSVYLKAKADLS